MSRQEDPAATEVQNCRSISSGPRGVWFKERVYLCRIVPVDFAFDGYTLALLGAGFRLRRCRSGRAGCLVLVLSRRCAEFLDMIVKQ